LQILTNLKEDIEKQYNRKDYCQPKENLINTVNDKFEKKRSLLK